jgi:hypothetical protein
MILNYHIQKERRNIRKSAKKLDKFYLAMPAIKCIAVYSAIKGFGNGMVNWDCESSLQFHSPIA